MQILSTQSSINTHQANGGELTAPTPAIAPRQNSDSNTQSDSPVSVKVSLSTQGLKKSAEANSNDDIEQSGLPDKAQKLLKMIRELKKQIEEKNEQLRALIADQSLTDEEKRSKVGAIQTTVAALSSSLTTASTTLDNLTKNGTLTAAQGQQAAQLAMK